MVFIYYDANEMFHNFKSLSHIVMVNNVEKLLIFPKTSALL